MKATNDLFQLINSLSANEKGYFKKYCLRNGEASSRNYIKLFDAVSALKEYDEKSLKKKLKDSSIVKNLSSEKNYLYHLILESLITSGSGQSISSEMEHEMLKAKILAEKAFYESARKFVDRIILYCKKAENYNLWLDALDLEILLWPNLAAEAKRDFEKIAEEKKAIIESVSLTEQARFFHWQVMQLFNVMGMGRNKEQLAKYEKVYEQNKSFYALNESRLPLSAKIFCTNSDVFYFNVSGNLPASCEALEKLIVLMESENEILSERMSLYISSINNLILVLLYLKRNNEALKQIEKLDNLKLNSLKGQNALFVCRYNTRFELYAKTARFEEAYELQKKLRDELEKQKNKVTLNFTIHIHYYSFRACFNMGKHKEALYWINRILNSSKETVRQEVLSMARISELVLHYELGNSDILDNLVSSASRYITKNDSLNEFEQVMLDFFKKEVDVSDEKRSFSGLKEKILKLEQNMMEQRVFSYFDFLAWAESKIQKRSIAEILKQKVETKP